MATPPPPGGYSLFPNTNTANIAISRTPSPSRAQPRNQNQTQRPPHRAATPQSAVMQDPRPSLLSSSPPPPPPGAGTERTPPRAGRRGSLRRTGSVRGEERQQQQRQNPYYARSQSAMDDRITTASPPLQPPPLQGREDPDPYSVPIEVPPRCETAFSEARTLVAGNTITNTNTNTNTNLNTTTTTTNNNTTGSSGNNNPFRSSIAKPPIAYISPGPGMSSSAGAATSTRSDPPAPLRSIFPQYNPDLPLHQQEYYPTQSSPTQIPRSAISRPMYSPAADTTTSPRSPPIASPMSAGSSSRWPGGGRGGAGSGNAEPRAPPRASTTEDLRGLWKAANGWKAPASEGRSYTLRMSAARDAPLYTLASATQPMYTLRLDPTSAAARVFLSRWDPAKPFRESSASSSSTLRGSIAGLLAADSTGSNNNTGGGSGVNKGWQEVLATTMEEESRKQPPNDGLVALLFPTAAMKLATDRPSDPSAAAAAERECARLVWDADSGSHFLVHPALAMPFCVTVERNAAWNRVEYTLEHVESPQHLGRLTRDATAGAAGGGTTGGGWLEIDTSIAAKIDAAYLVDVAIAALLLVAHADDKFVALETFEPPPTLPMPRNSVASSKKDSNNQQQQTTTKTAKRSRIEQFEIDIESQTSELNKAGGVRDRDKLPITVRALIKLLTIAFKCCIWFATLGFKVLTAVIAGLARCMCSDKL